MRVSPDVLRKHTPSLWSGRPDRVVGSTVPAVQCAWRRRHGNDHGIETQRTRRHHRLRTSERGEILDSYAHRAESRLNRRTERARDVLTRMAAGHRTRRSATSCSSPGARRKAHQCHAPSSSCRRTRRTTGACAPSSNISAPTPPRPDGRDAGAGPCGRLAARLRRFRGDTATRVWPGGSGGSGIDSAVDGRGPWPSFFAFRVPDTRKTTRHAEKSEKVPGRAVAQLLGWCAVPPQSPR